MIKLKNLWKIALATMAMSTMLVACDTDSKDNDDNNSNSDEKIVAKGGEGVYSYTVSIEDISSAWGGSTASPAFSIMLLGEKQLAACISGNNFKLATAAEPEYQLGAYGNLKINDTSKTGTFAIYGQNAVEDVYQYYTGIAAEVTDATVTVTIDMTKLVLTDLKALFAKNADGKDEATMTNDDIVDLKGYKPYILSLAGQATDPDNYKMSAWDADLMEMASGVTFPTSELKKDAPVVPTCKDLNSVAGTINGWSHAALTNNAVDFTAAGDDAFAFSTGSWAFKACGVEIDALDKEFLLKEGDDADITFKAGVLTVGKEYTATLIVKGNHEAYVKVTAK